MLKEAKCLVQEILVTWIWEEGFFLSAPRTLTQCLYNVPMISFCVSKVCVAPHVNWSGDLICTALYTLVLDEV